MNDWKDFSYLLPEIGKQPENGFIYHLINYAGDMMYIGQTRQPIARRLAGHAANKEWFNSICKVEAKEVPIETLDFAEGIEIHAYHPWGNRVCPLKLGGIRMCTHYTSRKSKLPPQEELDALAIVLEEARMHSSNQ